MQVNPHVLFYCRTKSVTQNNRGFIHRRRQGAYRAIHLLIFRRYSRCALMGGMPKKIVLTVFPQVLGWLRYWFYWKTAESRTKGAWGAACDFQNVVLRRVGLILFFTHVVTTCWPQCPLTTCVIIAAILKLTLCRRHYESTTRDLVHQKRQTLSQKKPK